MQSELAVSNASVKPGRGPGRPFVPGQVANPSGRPKGSRNKLGEDFVRALSDDFAANGIEAIKSARAEDPAAYLKIIAQVIPKEFVIREAGLDDMTDEQLLEAVESLRASRAKLIK